MNIVCSEHGTEHWLAMQARCISDSDTKAVVGETSTAAWRLLVEMLYLEVSGAPEDPDRLKERLAFKTRFIPEVRSCLKAMQRMTRTYPDGFSILPGLVEHDKHSWLVASPHAVTPQGLIHVYVHRTRRQWENVCRRPRGLEEMRARVLMYVCGRKWCDVVHYWDSGMEFRFDGYDRQRYSFSRSFIESNFLPGCKVLWQAVRRKRELAEASTA